MIDQAYIAVFFIFILIDILTLKTGPPILALIFGIFTLGAGATTISQSTLPFYPYIQLMMFITGIVTMFFAAKGARN